MAVYVILPDSSVMFRALKNNTHRLYESLGEDLPGLGLQGRGLGEPALVHHLALPVTLHLVLVTSETFLILIQHNHPHGNTVLYEIMRCQVPSVPSHAKKRQIFDS